MRSAGNASTDESNHRRITVSLNFDFKPIRERKEPLFCDRDGTGEKEYLSPSLDALIWATLIVGAQVDSPKFLTRLRAWETASGAFLHRPQEGHEAEAIARGFFNADTLTEEGYISAAEVKRASGLKTNASNLTDAAFAKKLATHVLEAAARDIRRETKDA
jgi:hypothetical protein